MVTTTVESSGPGTATMAAAVEVPSWFSPLPVADLVDASDSRRAEVQAYVQRKFLASYGAEIAHFLPTLLTLRCAGSLSGVAGIAAAGTHAPLFLEHYLDAPIEIELARLGLGDTGRAGIAEIGNLVATTGGASRVVFILLASMLHRVGLQWMVFTATGSLLANLQKLGFRLHTLRAADISRLPGSDNSQWGSYYEHAPMVVAGRLDCAVEIIANRKLFAGIQHLFDGQIDALAAQFTESQVTTC